MCSVIFGSQNTERNITEGRDMSKIAMKRERNTADFMVQCLEEEGVEYIFGIPGEENLAVMNAIEESDIRFITVRHEQGAAFMADVYGRLTGTGGLFGEYEADGAFEGAYGEAVKRTMIRFYGLRRSTRCIRSTRLPAGEYQTQAHGASFRWEWLPGRLLLSPSAQRTWTLRPFSWSR